MIFAQYLQYEYRSELDGYLNEYVSHKTKRVSRSDRVAVLAFPTDTTAVVCRIRGDGRPFSVDIEDLRIDMEASS